MQWNLLFLLGCLWLSSVIYAQDELQPITDQNAFDLQRLDPIGRGKITNIDWSPDGRWLTIETPIGIWLIDSNQEDTDPILLRVLDEYQAFAFSRDSQQIVIAGCRGEVPEYFILDPPSCANSETHVYDLMDANIGDVPLYVIDNGQRNISNLVIGDVLFWNAPLIIAQTDYTTLYLSNGRHSWEFDMSYHINNIASITLSPDSQILAVINQRGFDKSQVTLINMEEYAKYGIRPGAPTVTVPGGNDINYVYFTDDNNYLTAVTNNGTYQWSLDNLESEPIAKTYLQIPEEYEGRPPNLSSNYRFGYTREGQENYLWQDIENILLGAASSRSAIRLPDSDMTYRGFSPLSNYLMMGREVEWVTGIEDPPEPFIDGLIQLYDVETGEISFELSPAGLTHHASFSPDESKIVYLTPNHDLRIYHIDRATITHTVSGFASDSYGLAIMPDGKLIYSTCAIFVPTANTSSCVPSTLYIGEQSFTDDGFRTRAISVDGEIMVNSNLVFRDVESNEIIQELETNSSGIWHVDIHPDGTQLAVSGDSPELIALDGSVLSSIPLEIPVFENIGQTPSTRAIAYSPDGLLVATASNDGIGRLWNSATGALLATLHSEADPFQFSRSGDGITFSPDGRTVVFGSCYLTDGSSANACYDERVYMYDVETALAQRELYPDDANFILRGATDYTVSLLFNPDGSLIVGSTTTRGWESSAGDNVTIWSAKTGQLLNILKAHGATELIFSPDGRILYGNSNDGVIFRWGVQP